MILQALINIISVLLLMTSVSLLRDSKNNLSLFSLFLMKQDDSLIYKIQEPVRAKRK